MFTPTKTTPSLARVRDAEARVGASLRHGGHHEPQTLSTTTLPGVLRRESALPSSVVAADTSPGVLRWATASRVMIPLPST